MKLGLAVALLAGLGQPADDLLTVAEASDWQATATYDEVIGLIDRIEDRTTAASRLELGTSNEGRSIPLLVLASPPVETAEQARASGKAIVFAFGNIHAGEVCGKEALLMLARELALEPDHPLLDDLVIVLAPIYNADGNERMSRDNRPGQIGPALGMGARPNAQGLDLNRDYVKLESPEARALVRFLTEWDPHITIDTHTTNGSKHRYVLTYAAPLNPSGHAGPIEYVRDVMLPVVSDRLRREAGYETFFYGNFNKDRTAWQTYSAMPRYGGPYRGLRNQMSILSEAYAYADYKDRVLVTHAFVRQILLYAAEHRGEIIEIHERARRETIEAGRDPQPDDVVGVRHRLAAFDEPVTILGFEEGSETVPKDYGVIHLGRFEPTLSVRRPFAYLLPPGHDAIVQKLRQHGLEVKPFEGDATVETYTVTAIDRARRPFQGHRQVRLEVRARVETRTFAAGSIIVPLAQPLGNLAVYLLEPQSEDGLAAWNFFDEEIEVGADYPVMRVRSANDVSTE